MSDARTPEQRRAYIATMRRMQPIDELKRKARKADRRSRWSAESVDLSLAESWQRDASRRAEFAETFRLTFCSLCSTFAPIEMPVRHKPRCSANPVDDGPYPGFHAAGIMEDFHG